MEEMDADYDIDDDIQHLYLGFSFERPIYLYIWEILVIVTCLCNVVVISVLVRKKMRNPTFMILVAISLSDSLTGLVTLPTYIDVFQYFNKAASGNLTTTSTSNKYPIHSLNLSESELDYADRILRRNEETNEPSNRPRYGYFISEELCDWFMISKFFLSKSFHTVSVWLTLFLGLQRFLMVFGSVGRRRFTMKKTIIVCVCVSVLAPWLHVYHLFKDHSPNKDCKWLVPSGTECNSDCIYLWCVLMFGHLLPVVLLILFTVYFVCSMSKSTASLQQISGKTTVDTGLQARQNENRRSSRVVIAILISFLIPEVPYACFMLYIAISAHAELDTDLQSVRAIHAAYEILLVLSFNANFYIYTFINPKFRNVLKETIISPVYRAICCCSGHLFGYADKARNSMSMTAGNTTEMTVLNDADKKATQDRTEEEEKQPLK